MTDLRKYARGKPCQVRIPHYCNGGAETTVLAHIRLAGITGLGSSRLICSGPGPAPAVTTFWTAV